MKLLRYPPTKKQNKLSSIMNTIAPNGTHRSVTKVSNESTYRDFLVLSDMGHINDSHAFDEISNKNKKNMSDEPNDDQKPNTILIFLMIHYLLMRFPINLMRIFQKNQTLMTSYQVSLILTI
ncbi:unnamed protein product [Schistosoma margrebowiei]|uniref:Uncharacterized protein n=1 Tax=Schistosoma margrebowiei TaxID=48269 RepID=A0A183MHW6_9TREM|nr:unnamed protein product [Schistosoma margrebowiei]